MRYLAPMSLLQPYGLDQYLVPGIPFQCATSRLCRCYRRVGDHIERGVQFQCATSRLCRCYPHRSGRRLRDLRSEFLLVSLRHTRYAVGVVRSSLRRRAISRSGFCADIKRIPPHPERSAVTDVGVGPGDHQRPERVEIAAVRRDADKAAE